MTYEFPWGRAAKPLQVCERTYHDHTVKFIPTERLATKVECLTCAEVLHEGTFEPKSFAAKHWDAVKKWGFEEREHLRQHYKLPYVEDVSQLYPQQSIAGLRGIIASRRDMQLRKKPERQLIHLALRTGDVRRVLDGLALLGAQEQE